MQWLARFRVWAYGLFLLLSLPLLCQQLAKRIILKDGSYQLAVQYEIKGDRVHYLSAERGEWEDVPKSLVDWEATEKFEKDRANGAPPPEAVELDKQLDAERKADEAKTPLVAPGLRLSEFGSVTLLDNYQGQPQLVEIEQSGGDINSNKKNNILRAAINPLASAKQTIELPGSHAKVQSHAALPAIYVNVQPPDQGAATNQPQQAEQPWDRFKIVRAQVAKDNKRIIGAIKIAVFGKVSQEQNLIPTTAEQLTGGWVKVTPKLPLEPGEYAVAEMLGKEGMNLYVWDFGVNPSAPPNMQVTTPEASAITPTTPQKVPELSKRPK
jgi:hypothetical protein